MSIDPDNAITVPAPGKVNWFLRIVGQRPDCYHEIQTVMQCIDLCNVVEMSSREDGKIVFSCEADLAAEGQSLCERAAELVQACLSCPAGADIRVRHSIPNGAGLGGASADCAAVIAGLNRLWQLRLSGKALIDLARRLSCDAPFFLLASCAWIEGVGDMVYPFPGEERGLLLFVRDEGFSTGERYSHPDLPRSQPRLERGEFLGRSPASLAELGNAFEQLSCQIDEDVPGVFEIAGKFGPAFMTGSGATIVAVPPEDRDSDMAALAENASSELSQQGLAGWSVIPTQTLAKSPLLDFNAEG